MTTFSTLPTEAIRVAFDAEWARIADSIFRYIQSKVSPDDAPDVFSEVAMRAFRSYAKERVDSSFLSYVYTIANNECYRYYGRRARRRDREGEAMPDDVVAPGAEADPADNPIFKVIRLGRESGDLIDREANILLARAEDPDMGWNEIAEALDLSANNCAVIHCRAVPKLAVLCFTRGLDLIGGREAADAAFRQGRGELTDREENVFVALVLEERRSYRHPGWESDFRSACRKLSRFLTIE